MQGLPPPPPATAKAVDVITPSVAVSDADCLDSLAASLRAGLWLEHPRPMLHWLESAQREAAFWREAIQSRGDFLLEMVLATWLLERLLQQNKYMRDGRFTTWPSRDRHQLWAALWLACRFRPAYVYSADEVAAELSRLFTAPPPTSLIQSVQGDLTRRGLVEAAGNTGECVVLSRKKLEYVLDGDKLFVLRVAIASRRPWWQLPVAAQPIAAPRPPTKDGELPPPPRACRFRCVLLDERLAAAGSTLEQSRDEMPHSPIKCSFLAVGEGAASASATMCAGIVREGEHAFSSIEGCFEAPTTCSEVVVTTADPHGRVPPFRIEIHDPDAGGWRLVQCQPMPTAEEMCDSGRDAVRCFLPAAVPVTDLSVGSVAKLAGLVDQERRVVRWPSKQKQQGLIVSYLALHMLPDRLYSETEVDWLICTRFAPSSKHGSNGLPDSPTIKKEFERRGLVERQPGGAGFLPLGCKLKEAMEALFGE